MRTVAVVDWRSADNADTTHSLPLQLFPAVRIMENGLFSRSGKHDPKVGSAVPFSRALELTCVGPLSLSLFTLARSNGKKTCSVRRRCSDALRFPGPARPIWTALSALSGRLPGGSQASAAVTRSSPTADPHRPSSPFSVPLCFIYPPMLHLRARAKTRTQRALDYALITFGVLTTIYTTVQTVRVLVRPAAAGGGGGPEFGSCA